MERPSGQANETDLIIPFDTTQITSKWNYSRPQPGQPCHPLAAGAHAPAVAYGLQTDVTPKASEEVSFTLKLPSSGGGGQPAAVQYGMAVRRLVPAECEALQGFPRGYTAIPWRGKPADQCPDGPRYKALGNSMAVPVVRWIGRQIEYLGSNERLA